MEKIITICNYFFFLELYRFPVILYPRREVRQPTPHSFRTSPKKSSGIVLPFIIVNFYLNFSFFNIFIIFSFSFYDSKRKIIFGRLFGRGSEALWGRALPQIGKMRFGRCAGEGCLPSLIRASMTNETDVVVRLFLTISFIAS